MLGVLLMSFGGPNGPADVRPFLERVAAGRRIPPARLDEVAEHYLKFGGVSPINRLNAELVAALQQRFASLGVPALVTVGNRNWEPDFVAALWDLVAAGCQRIVLLPSSAYEAYSTCRQYVEDFEAAWQQLALVGVAVAEIEVLQAPPIWDEEVFAALWAEIVAEADLEGNKHVVFVTHSIPVAMDAAAGRGLTYSAQTRVVAERAARVGNRPWSLAYCSRSGPPHIPWLEPDICDHLAELAKQGVAEVVVVPVGFINDHMEVIFDLDTEAADTAAALGLGFTRAATVGVRPGFVAALADSVLRADTIRRGCCPEG